MLQIYVFDFVLHQRRPHRLRGRGIGTAALSTLLAHMSPHGRCEHLKNAKGGVWASKLSHCQILRPGCPGHRIGILHPLTKELVSCAIQSQFHHVIIAKQVVQTIVCPNNCTEAGISFDGLNDILLQILGMGRKVEFNGLDLHLRNALDKCRTFLF